MIIASFSNQSIDHGWWIDTKHNVLIFFSSYAIILTHKHDSNTRLSIFEDIEWINFFSLLRPSFYTENREKERNGFWLFDFFLIIIMDSAFTIFRTEYSLVTVFGCIHPSSMMIMDWVESNSVHILETQEQFVRAKKREKSNISNQCEMWKRWRRWRNSENLFFLWRTGGWLMTMMMMMMVMAMAMLNSEWCGGQSSRWPNITSSTTYPSYLILIILQWWGWWWATSWFFFVKNQVYRSHFFIFNSKGLFESPFVICCCCCCSVCLIRDK